MRESQRRRSRLRTFGNNLLCSFHHQLLLLSKKFSPE
jgi:hypothetical protein